jgi:hypothetical protein
MAAGSQPYVNTFEKIIAIDFFVAAPKLFF